MKIPSHDLRCFETSSRISKSTLRLLLGLAHVSCDATLLNLPQDVAAATATWWRWFDQ